MGKIPPYYVSPRRYLTQKPRKYCRVCKEKLEEDIFKRDFRDYCSEACWEKGHYRTEEEKRELRIKHIKERTDRYFRGSS